MIVGLPLVLGLSFDGTISRLDGVILLVGFVVYIGYSYVRRQQTTADGPPSTNVGRDVVATVLLLGLVLASASVLLAVVEDVVAGVVLGGSMVGVLTLGIASSFPELGTVLDGVRRRTPIVAVGTLIGSNVVNPVLGIGLGGAISTYTVPTAVIVWDLPFKIVAAVALAGYARYRGNALDRRVGIYLVGAYFLYITGRVLLFPGQ
ncbi:sodium:calcium antiporter [Halobaculum sp. MBLA0147]|uniref:sodium:calcium antiporter n=1 Tax=Halobaculum sp. MBLA0147 TaxID=3079934 RepID=UPI003524919A